MIKFSFMYFLHFIKKQHQQFVVKGGIHHFSSFKHIEILTRSEGKNSKGAINSLTRTAVESGYKPLLNIWVQIKSNNCVYLTKLCRFLRMFHQQFSH